MNYYGQFMSLIATYLKNREKIIILKNDDFLFQSKEAIEGQRESTLEGLEWMISNYLEVEKDSYVLKFNILSSYRIEDDRIEIKINDEFIKLIKNHNSLDEVKKYFSKEQISISSYE